MAGLVVPAAASLLVWHFLFPSRLDGGRGGLTGALARLADQHPLVVVVFFSIALTEMGRYWLAHFRTSDAAGVPPAPALSGRAVLRFSSALAAVALLAFVSRSSIVSTFRVVGPSMLPTLEIGDRVLVDRLAYGVRIPFAHGVLRPRAPRRGDLVVFRANGLTGADGPQSIVKRVVGVPGDRIEVQRGNILINDWPVPACDAGPYVAMTGRLTVRGRLVVEYLGDKAYLTIRKPVEPAFAGYTVRPGEVFVMGDDRGLSSDSRAWSEGHGTGVPVDALEGAVRRVLLGARPDGRLDLSRVLAPPLELRVRIPGIDTTATDARIASCLGRRPDETTPPAPRR